MGIEEEGHNKEEVEQAGKKVERWRRRMRKRRRLERRRKEEMG